MRPELWGTQGGSIRFGEGKGLGVRRGYHSPQERGLNGDKPLPHLKWRVLTHSERYFLSMPSLEKIEFFAKVRIW